MLLVLGIAVLGAGCGDDESSAGDENGPAITVETSSFSKVEFVKRAEAICARGSEDVSERLNTNITRNLRDGDKTEPEVVADAIRIVALPRVEAEIEEIRDLGAPRGDESQIEAFLEAMQESVESLEAKQGLFLTDVGPAFRQPGVMARAYGIVGCAFN